MVNGSEPTIEELRAFTGDDGLPAEFWDRQMYYTVGRDTYCATCVSKALAEAEVTELEVEPEFLYAGRVSCSVCDEDIKYVA